MLKTSSPQRKPIQAPTLRGLLTFANWGWVCIPSALALAIFAMH